MSAAKTKGRNYENEVKDVFNEAGFKSRRVPLSGALKDHPGDVVVEVRGTELILECKRRESVPLSIYKWLDQSDHEDLLVMRRNRKPSVVVMYLDKFVELLK